MLKTQLEANLNVLINNIYMELKQTGKYYRYIHVALREFKIELRTSTTKTTVFIACRPVTMDAVKKLCEILKKQHRKENRSKNSKEISLMVTLGYLDIPTFSTWCKDRPKEIN